MKEIRIAASEVSNITSLEWLETNGLGGWAMSTISGLNTRMYHGLLVAATRVPVERHVMVSHLDETIESDDQCYELFSHGFQEGFGKCHLVSFEKGLFPTFIYSPKEGIKLEKTVVAINGENTTLVRYRLLDGSFPITLKLRPLIAARYYHDYGTSLEGFAEECHYEGETLSLKPKQELPTIYISVPSSSFEEDIQWLGNFSYAVEKYRGIEGEEKLFQPGILTLTLRPEDSITVVLSLTRQSSKGADELLKMETKRREKLLELAEPKSDDEAKLLLAADQFIVQRQADKRTIIAGYPWFTDWGRDTMISLEGLCLVTRRYSEARLILQTFVDSLSQGMLPNRFPDQGEEPEYNTVDGTLWFFVAAQKYYEYTNDCEFVKETIYPAFCEIIEWHERGTRYSIKEDCDGLISAGSPTDQLTWMDAKVDDWVVTPRHGKAVEISALWYNALLITAGLAKQFGDEERAVSLEQKAAQTKESFQSLFWNEELGCCFDVITEGERDCQIRPNQLLALSLPFPLLDEVKAKSLLQCVEELLVTPRGLRSLSPEEADYQAIYGGDRVTRDGAYHQGTVWSWLFGPYYFAVQKFGDRTSKEEANSMLEKFLNHLNESGVGSVSEIFDGQEPFFSRGCPAQAWGVAELLRCLRAANKQSH